MNRRHGNSGSRNRNAKLTERDVYEILGKADAGVRQCDLAREYGVSDAMISGIVLKKFWRHVDPTFERKHGLTIFEKEQAVLMYEFGITQPIIGRIFGVSPQTISNVVMEKTNRQEK